MSCRKSWRGRQSSPGRSRTSRLINIIWPGAGSSTSACRAIGLHAEEQFRKAVAIDPNYAEALAELAILWGSDPGTAQQAEKAIERALSLKPDLARAYAAQGRLLEGRHPPDYARSEAAFRKALTLDPNMVDASNWLATILETQGRYAEALRRWKVLPGSTRSRRRS